MSRQKVLQQVIAVMLVMGFLVGCGAPAATPVSEAPVTTSTPEPPTPTPEPPTATPVPPTPTPTPIPPTPTPLPQIGDEVISESGSLQVRVLQVAKIDSVKGDYDVTIQPEQGFTILSIRLELKNLSEGERPTLILGPGFSEVQDIQQQVYPLADVGILDNDLPHFLPTWLDSLIIGVWQLDTDTTGELRVISIPVGSSVELLLVYFVPPESPEFILSLPDFSPISLQVPPHLQ